jgi:hypothetical protein
MFLNKPHLSHRHESVLLREQANILFQESQSKLPYFTACYAFYKLEQLFREGRFHPDLKAYKAHLLMMFRESIGGRCPNINFEKPIDDNSNKIIAVLKNEITLKQQFEKIAVLFKKTMGVWINQMGKSRFAIKDVPEFTSLLLKETQNAFSVKPEGLSNDEDFVYKGVVMRTLLDRFGNSCGFIKRSPDNIFFHSQQSKHLNFREIEGRLVSYQVAVNPNDDRPLAINVELIK